MASSTQDVEELVKKEYEHGFVTDIDSDTIAPGLNEDVIAFISKKKVPKPDVIILSSLPILPVINLMFFKLLYPRCKLVFEIRDLWPDSITCK